MKAKDHETRILGAFFTILALVALLGGCQDAQDPPVQTPAPVEGQVVEQASEPDVKDDPTQRWQCRNDLEIHCGDGACAAESGDGFTPMSVDFDDTGSMSVCAYSGCWEGSGEVVKNDPFLVVTGRDLAFSTAPDEDGADVVIALDRNDAIAMLKVGEFAHPVICDSLDTTS